VCGVAEGPAVIEFCGRFRFAVPPAVVWAALERTNDFERWWGWLGEFHVDGPGLEAGSILVGTVSPPLPYRMRVEVVLEECVRPESITAAVHGDLEGHAHLTLASEGGGTLATAEWTIEMMQRTMRLADRVAHPLLQWGHDRVVDATVAGFRRTIEAAR
jgi:carbon monoxide dehydrogenase subunit G